MQESRYLFQHRKDHKEQNINEKIRNRNSARVCVINRDTCGRDARWRQVGAAANAIASNVEHDQHIRPFAC